MRKFSIAFAASASLFAMVSPAWAQDAADEEAAEDESIIVTGTLIRGTEVVGAQTISLDAEDIAAKGASSVNELLGTIPQIANAFNGRFEGDPRGIAGSGTSITRPNLRNLPSAGSTSGSLTLVLADGMRLTPVGVNQAAVDPDLIPAAVIQGIDVVTDGGSSLYGADAVAGVLNFRSLRKFDGIKVDGNFGFGTTLKSYKVWDAAITAGTSWTGGNAYVSVSHSDRDEVLNGDTSWSNGIVYNAAGVPRTTFTQCDAPQQTVTRWGRFGTGITSFTANPGFPGAGPAALGTGCDRVVEDSYSPRLTRTNVYGSLSQEFGDNIDLRVTGYWAKREVELHSYARGTTSAGSGITTAAQLNAAYPIATAEIVGGIVPPGAVARGGFFTVPEGVGFSFGPNAAYENTPQRVGFETWGVTPELTVKLGSNWQVRTSAHFGRSDSFQSFPGVNTVRAQCYITGCTGIAAGQLNPLNVAAASAAVIADINNFENAQQTKQQLVLVRAIVDGTIFALPAGDAKMAFGVEYQDNKADSRLATGTVGLVDTLPFRKAQRNAKSVFAELTVPVTSFLDVNGSVRYDDYSDFGSTTNPNIGLSLKPFDGLKIFGHWNTSFNAPTAIDNLAIGTGRFACGIYVDYSANPSLADPARRPTDQSVLTGGALPLRDTSRQGTCALVLQGSSPGLKPQTAESWAVGFEATPVSGVRIGGEYYSVDLKNALGTLNPSITSTYLTNPNLYTYNITGPEYAAVLATLGNGAALGLQQPSSNIAIVVDTRISNLNAARIEGVDAHFSMDLDAGSSKLTLGTAGTFLTKALITNGGVLADKLGRDDPRLFASTWLALANGGFTGRVTVNYRGSYRDAAINNLSQVERVNAFVMTNLAFGYNFESAGGALGGLSLRLNIDNVFDKEPQTIKRLNTNNPSYNNWTLGRVIKLGASMKF
jgi:iron complex outermembrane recepter protein